MAFSIENRSVIQVKQKRAEKSKLNNPLCPASKKPRPEEPRKREKMVKRRLRSENVPTFAGIESHPGQTSLASKRKILSQQEVHSQNVKEVKRDRRRKQQALQMRKEKKKEPKVRFEILLLYSWQVQNATLSFAFINWPCKLKKTSPKINLHCVNWLIYENKRRNPFF